MRSLDVSGCFNLRDVGGYETRLGRRVRWRTLLRSGAFAEASPAARRQLRELGVRTIVDLRDEAEIARRPCAYADDDGLQYRWVPLLAPPQPSLDVFASRDRIYRHILDERQEYVAASIRVLLEPRLLPAVVSCTEGKDRTGLLIALVLLAVGVPRETVAADFALSAECLSEEYLETKRQMIVDRGWRWEDYEHLWDCTPEVIGSAIDHVDRAYGGVDAYLDTIGVVGAARARLLDLLTDGSPAAVPAAAGVAPEPQARP